MLIIKNKFKMINLRMRFLALKIVFLGGFENDNILSSKSYMVKKSGISPPRKLGSLRYLQRKLIRYKLTTKFFLVRITACIRSYEPFNVMSRCLWLLCACACTDLYKKEFGGQLLSNFQKKFLHGHVYV